MSNGPDASWHSPKKIAIKTSASLRSVRTGQTQELVESTDGESEYHEAASHIAFDEDDEDDENEGYGEEQDTGVNADGSPTTPQQDQLQLQIPTTSSQTLANSTEPRSSATFPVSVHSRAPTPSFELKREDSFATTTGKEKKKAVSFLSRFLTTTKKKATTLPVLNDLSPGEDDRASIASYPRQEAMSGPAFSQDIDNIEFSPKIPHPTAYTKVKSKNKRDREFDRLFLAQELRWHNDRLERADTKISSKSEKPDKDAIWALSFSTDGKYLAAGGENKSVKIWSVLSNEEDREAQEIEDNEYPSAAVQMKAPVFNSTPVQTYTDHDGAILDLQWSKNHFLLVTSQDRTVRLFHPSRNECLCTFKHNAPVLAIAFHPKDDRFFLAGCKDGKLRLWGVPDKRIEFSATVGDMITAVAFSPDGKTCMAGTVSGSIHLFSTETLKPMGQIPVRSKRKSRITGIEIRQVPSTPDSYKLLVTTTDSRIRLYNLRDKALELKLKAHKNEELTMRATISDDGHYIISPSEDKNVYLWSLSDSNLLPTSDRDRDKSIQRPLEYFEANGTKTTCAVLAPVDTRILLGQSGCPIYDVCNPPPVRLVEREGSINSSTKHNGSAGSVNGDALHKPIPRSTTTPTLGTPTQEPRKGNETPRTAHSASFPWDVPTKSQYQARASHEDGHIIVTASSAGVVRIFRQDCAHSKRKSTDFSRAYLRRAFGSRQTSYSGPANARPPSISSYKGLASSIKSQSGQRNDGRIGGELTVRGKSRSESVSSHPSRDRIERWRLDIEGRGSTTSLKRNGSIRSAASVSTAHTNTSPSKQNDVRSSLAEARRGTSIPRSTGPVSQPSTVRVRTESGTTADDATIASSRKTSDPDSASIILERESLGPRRSSSYIDPLRLVNGQSFMFWNTSQYKPERSDSVGLAPDEQLVSKVSRMSAISRLTDEIDSEIEEVEDDGQQCPRCGGTELKTKETRGWGFGKSKSLVCEDCGLERRETG